MQSLDSDISIGLRRVTSNPPNGVNFLLKIQVVARTRVDERLDSI